MEVRVVRRVKSSMLQLRWVDPVSGRLRQRSAGTNKPEVAERKAAELRERILEGKAGQPMRLERFAARVVEDYFPLANLAANSERAYRTALAVLIGCLGRSMRLEAITPAEIMQAEVLLRKRGKSQESIRSYKRVWYVLFGWAVEMGWMPKVPKTSVLRSKQRSQPRGRALSEQEFAKMLEVVPLVVGEECADRWRYFLRGLWHSGLRIEELRKLSWDSKFPLHIELNHGGFPRFVFAAGSQKSGKAEEVPIVPEFYELLLETPEAERFGLVFPIKLPVRMINATMASKTVSDIGRAAGITVNETTAKPASAHDFRRSFATRMAMRFPPVILKTLMRHSSLSVTMKHYVGLECDSVAAEVWGKR